MDPKGFYKAGWSPESSMPQEEGEDEAAVNVTERPRA